MQKVFFWSNKNSKIKKRNFTAFYGGAKYELCLEQDNENIGVVLVYAKPLNDEQSGAITQALSKRFITYFKMSELDLEALIKVH